MALTTKQRRFADRYLIHFNGARAAREAGYSTRYADRIAYQNLRKVEIREYLDERLRSLMAADEIEQLRSPAQLGDRL